MSVVWSILDRRLV